MPWLLLSYCARVTTLCPSSWPLCTCRVGGQTPRSDLVTAVIRTLPTGAATSVDFYFHLKTFKITYFIA